MPELIALGGMVVAVAIVIGVSVWAWNELRSAETGAGPPSEMDANRG